MNSIGSPANHATGGRSAPRAGADATIAAPQPTFWRRLNRAAADFWLDFLFWNVRTNDRFVRWSKPFWLASAWTFSDHLYGGLMSNAAHILGAASTPAEREALARRTMSNFYDFVHDVGLATRLSREQLLARIDSTEGENNYRAARAARAGAILVSAHMGSFEVGIAALRAHERKIHVLFHTDERGRFERIRSTLRQKLGVEEVHIDEGWTVWMRLRDALAQDEAVLIQGDRVLPGHKGQTMPFFDGHMLLPTGPVKLALATGAPIIPVFTVRTPEEKVKVFLEEAIHVGPTGDPPDVAMNKLTAVIEKYIRRFPDQWLANQPAWFEDAGRPTPRPPVRRKLAEFRKRLLGRGGLRTED